MDVSLTSLGDIGSGSIRDREKAVDGKPRSFHAVISVALTYVTELADLLNPRNRNSNLSELGDRSYHKIFEAIFAFVLSQKPSFFDKGKSQKTSSAAGSRLSKCANAVRMAVGRGLLKFTRKTLLAIIDHITQVLPGPDEDYVAPLLQDYVKSLSELLSRHAHVELLARKGAAPWEDCVDFFLDLTEYALPEESNLLSGPMSRVSPTPGTLRSTGRSSSSTQSSKRVGHGEGGPLRDALEGLHHLTQGSNAPLPLRSSQIVSVILRVLRIKHMSLGSIQTLCFAILNTIFSSLKVESFQNANDLVKEMVPLMAYWWRAEKVSQDELIRALRNEILKAIFLNHLHLEYLALHAKDIDMQSSLEDLADPIWQEYSKRGEAFRLQFVDITFATSNLPHDHLRNALFGLRPHNVEGESYWALVQNLAFLESLLLRCKNKSAQDVDDNAEQPRKRRRTQEQSSRLRLKLRSKDVSVRRTALQLVPFIVSTNAFGDSDAAQLFDELIALGTEKDAITSSWVLVACASCAIKPKVLRGQQDVWRQAWHMAARSVSLPGTSRAACALLRVILISDFLPYHIISEELSSIVTTADVHGPAVLSDTSLALMTELFHIRNTRLPSASQATCSHIIRWMFLKWNPSESFPSVALIPS